MLDASEVLNANILIMADQAVYIRQLQQLLATAGYQHVSTDAPNHAVSAQFDKQLPDLIIFNLDVENSDGLQIMGQLLQETQRRQSPLPILVTSQSKETASLALQSGAKDYFGQPMLEGEVLARIRNLLETVLLQKKLRNYNQLLEKTVQERTQELRQSEASFKSFAELSSDWFWEQDQNGKFTKVSGPVFEMLGIDSEQTLLAALQEADNAVNSDERTLLHKNIASRRPFLDFVYSRNSADGSLQYLQVSGEPMFDASSRFIGYRGIGMEITDRRRPDQEQQRFRIAMDVIGVGILLIDRSSMQLIDFNETVCHLLSYSRTQLTALSPEQIGLGPRSTLEASFDELINHQKKTHQDRLQLRCSDGSQLKVDLTWHVVRVVHQSVMVGVFNLETQASAA